MKLKSEIKKYETRMESVLEDSSVKEKAIIDLREETSIIKEINQGLEMEVSKQN